MKFISKGEYCTVKEFAKLNGLTVGAIYAALRQGRLVGERIDKTYIILKSAVIQNSNKRDGRYIGIRDLERGDMKTFLEKRGFRIEE